MLLIQRYHISIATSWNSGTKKVTNLWTLVPDFKIVIYEEHIFLVSCAKTTERCCLWQENFFLVILISALCSISIVCIHSGITYQTLSLVFVVPYLAYTDMSAFRANRLLFMIEERTSFNLYSITRLNKDVVDNRSNRKTEA